MNSQWLNVWFTNLCNYNCASCAHRSVLKYPIHHTTWEELESLSVVTQGFNIALTGGEPALHPSFTDYSPKLRQLWPKAIIALQTNGSQYEDAPEVYASFDVIHVSRYPKKRNASLAAAMLECYGPDKIKVIDPVHIPAKLNGKFNPCFRKDTFSYWKKAIYPCCVGPAVRDNPSVSVTPDWLDQVQKLSPNCFKCRHAE